MSIRVFENRLILLETAHTAYAMGVDAAGVLRHLYYGAKVARGEDFLDELDRIQDLWPNGGDRVAEEFSAAGCLRNKETSLRLRYADRTRDFRYAVEKIDVQGERLTVTLKDADYGFAVELLYTVLPEHDIIGRAARAVNLDEEAVELTRLFSMELPLPGDDYEFLNMTGHWGAEHQLCIERVSGGKKVYESVHGTTAFDAQPNWAAGRGVTETAGEVWFGALQWTGNFKVVAESIAYHYLNVTAGVSDTGFSKTLRRGETYETPVAWLGFSREGYGGMSRLLHRFAHDCLMPAARRDEPLEVLYNSWYATEFDVVCEEQERLADKAAKAGVELFVIDDGWFGQRANDRAGLGDWYVNPEKFPQGLAHLIDHVHGLGMRFGLWIEPEMVNPDSDLFRAHPDWIYAYPRRETVTGRNQYCLNMTKTEVVDHLIEVFDRLLAEHGIDYIKWDMNRFMAEALDDGGEDGMVYVHHAQGVIRLARALRERHPEVSFEACAGGGARVNYETMSIFDQFWPSDNTDPIDRCRIQEGYSYFYPAKYMRAWVTDDPRLPFTFRARCAMCGSFGVGSNLNAMSDAELEEVSAEVALYKRIRPAVQFVELYRLRSMREGGVQIWQYVTEKLSAVISVVDHTLDPTGPVRLQGLEPDALYRVEGPCGIRTLSGAYLMGQGIQVTGSRHLSAEVTVIERL